VRDRDGGDPGLLQDFADLFAHLDPEVDVEIRERFVEEEKLWLRGQRARQGDSLLLTAGELLRGFVAVIREADEFEEVVDPAFAVVFVPLLDPEGDVFAGREVWEERELLENDADVPLFRGDEPVSAHVVPVESNDAAVGSFQSGDQPERRRLSAPGRAQEREQFPVPDGQGEIADHRGSVVGFLDSVELQHRAGRRPKRSGGLAAADVTGHPPHLRRSAPARLLSLRSVRLGGPKTLPIDPAR